MALDHFIYKNETAYCEDVSLSEIADAVGTPAYIYSSATLDAHCQALGKAFKEYPTLLCFAVKASSNISVLRKIFANQYGADVVSVGELERALIAGANPRDIIYSGVGKRADEIQRALDAGIYAFNVESEFELRHISAVAKAKKKKARISLRFNPNIDAKTHPKIATGLFSTKFGIPEPQAKTLLAAIKADPFLSLVGLGCHIGSQIVEISPLAEAAARMAALSDEVRAAGFPLEFVNMGGGLGIRYKDENPPSPETYASTLINAVRPTGLRLLVEPGRVVVGNAGVLLTRVIGTKDNGKRIFIIVDAAMNDLLRPSIYGSFHSILPCDTVEGADHQNSGNVDVVGPICETGDFLGLDRNLKTPAEGALLFVRSCGAYGSSMASNYNSRPRSPEVLVSGKTFKIIRPRESLESLWASET